MRRLSPRWKMCSTSIASHLTRDEANRMWDGLKFHYTPKRGSWLNMAEIELGVLSRQCLDRRIPDQPPLIQEVAAWETERNTRRATVHWRFPTADARVKLHK